jgi:hypothetical protein
LAVANYWRTANTLFLHHTEVPYPMRGRRIGVHLARGMLNEVRGLGAKRRIPVLVRRRGHGPLSRISGFACRPALNQAQTCPTGT